MSESPYNPPSVTSTTSEASPVDQAKLHKDLANAKKGNSYTLLLIPVVGFSTAMQYAGLFSAGSLPPWFGLLVIGLCVVQLFYFQFKIKKLEATLATK